MSRASASGGYGERTISIMRNAKYPVMSVPEDVSFSGIKTILFAYDAYSISPSNKLLLLKEIVDFFNAQLHIFHIEKNKEIPVTLENSGSKNVFDVDAVLKEINFTYENIASHDIVKSIEDAIEKSMPICF